MRRVLAATFPHLVATDTGPEITYVGRALPPKPQTRRSGLSSVVRRRRGVRSLLVPHLCGGVPVVMLRFVAPT